MRGKNQEENKKINKNLILKLIITNQNLSRVALSHLTGLTKMSVSNIVGELIDDGFVTELVSGETALGRKPVLLQAVSRSMTFMGIYISRSKIISFLGDLMGETWNEYSILLKNETRESFEQKLIDVFKYQYNAHVKIESVGISCIGPLDSKHGIILNPPNFFGLQNINIFSLLQDYSIPIYLENDMNTSAIAEKYYGHAKNMENYIYVGVTNGIGSGIVANGSLYIGNSGFSGEIGHITVDACGRPCPCGNVGCLELYIPPVAQWDSANLPDICNFLGAALVTASNLFDPQVIFLGHEISAYTGIDEALGNILNQRIITSKHKNIPVQISKFEGNSPIYGAIAYAIDRMLNK